MRGLHLVRLPVDLDELGRWSAERNLGWGRRTRQGEAEIYDEGAALHHLLAETFGPAALQPFRLMVALSGGPARIYGYSRKPGPELAHVAGVAMLPEVARVIDLGGLESRAMPMDWRSGQRLGFDLRMRPVVRLASDILGHRKGAEVDAFLAEALRQPEGTMLEVGRTREAVYLDWLAGRLGSGATVESARLVRFERRGAVRKGARIEGPDIVIQGTMTISDPAVFADLLGRGIGRHRAYGYGMMLLRPPATQPPQW